MNESLEKILEYIEKGAEFANEQAPLVAQEILEWELRCNLGIVAVCLITICISCVVFIASLIEVRKNPDEDLFWIGVFIGAGGFCASLATSLVAAWAILKVNVAPRLVLIEKLREMLN